MIFLHSHRKIWARKPGSWRGGTQCRELWTPGGWSRRPARICTHGRFTGEHLYLKWKRVIRVYPDSVHRPIGAALEAEHQSECPVIFFANRYKRKSVEHVHL